MSSHRIPSRLPQISNLLNVSSRHFSKWSAANLKGSGPVHRDASWIWMNVLGLRVVTPWFQSWAWFFCDVAASLTLAVAAAAPSQSPSSLHASYGSAFVNFLDFATDMSCSLILAQCLVVCVVLELLALVRAQTRNSLESHCLCLMRWTSMMFLTATSCKVLHAKRVWTTWRVPRSCWSWSHEKVPWMSEFADRTAPVAPQRVATIGYVFTDVSDELFMRLVSDADTVGVAEIWAQLDSKNDGELKELDEKVAGL